MTLTRELRTTIAFTLAILLALTAFVWGNQRLAHADTTLAKQILCWIDNTNGIHPPVPKFNVGDCSGSGGTVVPPPPQCFDGIDNDGDGKIDWSPIVGQGDPGCSTPTDNNESDDPVVIPPAQCSDGIDNDGDGLIDFPADPGCSSAADNDETNATSTDQGGGTTGTTTSTTTDSGGGGTNTSGGSSGSGSSGGSSHHSSSNGGSGEVLGAQTDCPMYLVGYIKQGANNDAGEVAKLQAFLNDFEANSLKVSGVYDAPTLAAVNAFQRKYSTDVLEPWGLKGTTGYVYYTTQKEVNTIYCKFQKDFPLSASQIQEIASVRQIQPTIHAQHASAPVGTSATKPSTTVSSAASGVVLPGTQADKNATKTGKALQTAAAANASSTASSTPGWFGKFINWLFGK